MRQVRYQVFISSTFRDLQEERQAVLDAILNLNHFPAGMELFPASDSTPWEVIERVIDDSDYYILIVGGIYGSTDDAGISYTEREYDYAKETNKPVLAFLPKHPELIPVGKTEMQASAQKKLREFQKKIQKHHCKYWEDAKDLQYQVVISLSREISFRPAIGWIRASEATNEDLLKRVDRLTRENERLRELTETQRSPQVGRVTAPVVSKKSKRSGPIKVFLSYANADSALSQELQKHLMALRRQGVVGSWHDRRVNIGDEWQSQLDEHLESADIILLLVSADFLASDYCFDVEMKRAIERNDAGEARVVPVILRPCFWEDTPFGMLQALPRDAQPVTTWSDRDQAFYDVVKGIEAIAEQLTNVST